MPKVIVLIFLILNFLVFDQVIAQSDEIKLEKAIDGIESQISSLDKSLNTKKNSLSILRKKKDKINLKITDIDKDLRTYNTELEKLLEKLSGLKKQLGELATASTRVKARIRERLRHSYIDSEPSELSSTIDIILNSDVNSDTDTLVYLAAIKKWDHSLIKKSEKLKITTTQQSKKLEELNLVKKELINKLRNERNLLNTELEKAKSNEQKIVKQETSIKQKKMLLDKKLVLLRKKLDRIMFESKAANKKNLTNSKAIAKNSSNTSKSGYNSREKGNLSELEGLPKSFSKPVNGKIFRKFGKHRVSNHKELIFNRGVDFKLQGFEVAKSVASGIVSYIGSVPRYGKVVIIDHGSDDYTMFGRLAKVEVAMGDVLNVGGSVGSSNSMIYFEVRKSGKPKNPVSFFK